MFVNSSWFARLLGVSGADSSALLRAGQAVALIAGALVVWFLSLPEIRLNDIGAFGLISALPWTFFVALGALIVGFGVALGERTPSALLLTLYTLALNVMLRATIPLTYAEPRYSWMYKHIGVTNYIRQHGGVNPLVDAYHNWPGFFALSALFTDAAGYASPIQYAAWAQLFFNVLYLGPLMLIFRTFTRDRRVVWGGVWFFFLINWVGQDYFAPQAFAFFLFLVILALALTALRGPGFARRGGQRRGTLASPSSSASLNLPQDAPADGARETAAPSVWQGVGLTLVILVLFGAITASHQLTPPMTIAAVTALVLFRQLRVRTLPLWLIGATLLWDFSMAATYMAGHNDWYRGFGNLTHNLDSSLRKAAQDTAGRTTSLLLTQIFTLSVWAVAFLGGVRRLRWGHRDWAPALLALAPFPLIATGSYGGEMLLRVFLFSSPFMAFFAAALIYPDVRARPGRFTTALSVVLSGAFLVGFLYAHFANELTNRIRPEEVATSRYLYHALPPGSLLMFVSYSNFPEKIAGNYDRFSSLNMTTDYHLQLDDASARNFDVNDFARFLREQMQARHDDHAYVVFTGGQTAFVEFFGLLPKGAITNVKRDLRESGLFHLIYQNGDAQVYALAAQGGTP